ncbi:hypothetical protein EHI44_29550 [Rhizobium leguminosarum]|nr:hypothetical protein EHI44_29550 [Rhizobium leguminosarum]
MGQQALAARPDDQADNGERRPLRTAAQHQRGAGRRAAAPYDGVAEIWFESQENFFKVATSPES